MRNDITNRLVHLTKGTTTDASKHREEAFVSFVQILRDGKLKAGDGFIRGSYKCVCFSEAPVNTLAHLLSYKDSGVFKYQPYGVMFTKEYIYEQGGRPVIYGPDSDFDLLPDDLKYRYVKFKLGGGDVDFTWEREWRLHKSELVIDPKLVTLVVPNRDAKEVLLDEFPNTNWHCIALSDLGVDVDSL